jgi:hypothetical protein
VIKARGNKLETIRKWMNMYFSAKPKPLGSGLLVILNVSSNV